MTLHTTHDEFSNGLNSVRRDEYSAGLRHTVVGFLRDHPTIFEEADHVRRDSAESYELRSVRPGMRDITVVARLSDVETQRVDLARGTMTVSLGTLSDDSGQLSFVASRSDDLHDGIVLKILHSVVADVNGEPVLVITDRSVLVPMHYEEMPPIRQLAQLKSGDKGANLVVGVLETELKRVGSRFVLVGTLADESGKLPFTSWGPHLDEGVVIRVENAYVKSWNGIPTVNISDASELYEVDVEVPARLTAPHHAFISDLAAREGAYDVIVHGDVISIRPDSGFVERCPRCKRVAHNQRCVTHGAITPLSDFRIKAFIDDGTGTMTAIIGRAPAEALCRALRTGEGVKAMKSLRSFEANMQRLLTGMTLALRGNATTGEYGTTFVVKKAVVEHNNHLSQLKKRLEEL